MKKFFDWLGRVYVGWKNVILHKRSEEADRRYAICMECEDKIKMGRNGGICSKCYCPLAAKTASPEEKCLNDKG